MNTDEQARPVGPVALTMQEALALADEGSVRLPGRWIEPGVYRMAEECAAIDQELMEALDKVLPR